MDIKTLDAVRDAHPTAHVATISFPDSDGISRPAVGVWTLADDAPDVTRCIARYWAAPEIYLHALGGAEAEAEAERRAAGEAASEAVADMQAALRLLIQAQAAFEAGAQAGARRAPACGWPAVASTAAALSARLQWCQTMMAALVAATSEVVSGSGVSR